MSVESPATKQPRPSRIPWGVWIGICLVLAAALAFTYVSFRKMREASKLEKYALAPEFTFTGQDGRTVSTSDLKGKVWVVNFIFTRCSGPCPVMTGKMATLKDLLGADYPDAQLVSITVDPGYDTPAVLKEYGERVGASPDRWKFLTGPNEQIQNVVVKGFLQPLSKDAEGAPMHSIRFVLVDREGWIRGFQDGNDPDVAAKLKADIQNLLRE